MDGNKRPRKKRQVKKIEQCSGEEKEPNAPLPPLVGVVTTEYSGEETVGAEEADAEERLTETAATTTAPQPEKTEISGGAEENPAEQSPAATPPRASTSASASPRATTSRTRKSKRHSAGKSLQSIGKNMGLGREAIVTQLNDNLGARLAFLRSEIKRLDGELQHFKKSTESLFPGDKDRGKTESGEAAPEQLRPSPKKGESSEKSRTDPLHKRKRRK